MTDLIETTFQRECSLNVACNDRDAFFTSEEHKSPHISFGQYLY